MADRIPTPFRQRMNRARVGALPFLVWLAAVFLAMRLWLAGPRPATYFGLAHAEEVQVSAPVDARLDRIHVQLYEAVEAGDPLATLDDADLEARIVTATAELERLAADVEGQRASLVADDEADRRAADARYGTTTSTVSLEYPAELRAFHADEARLDLDILETRLAVTMSELEADRVEVRLRRAESMVESEIGPRIEVEDLEKRLAQEIGRAEGLRVIAAEIEADLEEARHRRRSLEERYEAPPSELFPEPAYEARLAGWRAAIVVQERRLDELDLRREAYLLRAPAAGRVAAVLASAGEYLLAGDPVVLLVDPEPLEVDLWVPESTPAPPNIGDRFVVTGAYDGHSDAAECVVRSMSPRLEVMPQRLWRDTRVAEYGRACRIGPVAALQLVPGQQVRIDPVGDTANERP